jgi:hypothetical protein
MKSFGIIHIIVFLLLMIAYQCSNAQDYLITTKGDSVVGKIKPMNFGPDKKVQVVSADKKKTTYSLFQVNSFVVNGETFKPAKGPSGYTFMKLLKSGYLSLFAYQMENQTSYDGRFMLKKDGTGIEVPNLSFKKAMKNFLNDCGDFASQIEAGTYTKSNLDKLIDDYNACTEGRRDKVQQAVSKKIEETKKLSPWDALDNKVRAMGDFQGKTDALEMITEIKGKISRQEKVPNFMIEGLKSALSQHGDIQSDLQSALKEIQ